MSSVKNHLITAVILGIPISSPALIVPLTGYGRAAASVSFTQTIKCPNKVVTSVSPATGDASTPQTLDIVVSNAAYVYSSNGEVVFLATDAFAMDSEDPSNMIAATTFSRELIPGFVYGFNPLKLRATFNFSSANACKTFKFFVTTICLGTAITGQSEPGGSFTLDCPFAALSARARIDTRPPTNDDTFDLRETFILAPASNGIDPLTEDVTLQLGSFSITIPSGSFAKARNGRWDFAGEIGDLPFLDVQIRPLSGGGFDLRAKGAGANLDGTVNPLLVKLAIGNDYGSTTITAVIR
ncbi:MAG: hypothetical protein AB1631_20190 [Acidobacteriota bacterium]